MKPLSGCLATKVNKSPGSGSACPESNVRSLLEAFRKSGVQWHAPVEVARRSQTGDFHPRWPQSLLLISMTHFLFSSAIGFNSKANYFGLQGGRVAVGDR